jgi:hypothetical protein
MADTGFITFRNEVIGSLNKFDVLYKLVGGSIVQLIDDSRITNDLDIIIKNSKENTDRLIKALTHCNFAGAEELNEQIYGDDGAGVMDIYDSFWLTPSDPRWSEYHIDLCYQLAAYSYDMMPEEYHTTADGLRIRSVPFRYIAHMKANVFPRPREHDISDIKTIADYLGLDPSTGEPIKEKKGWWKR